MEKGKGQGRSCLARRLLVRGEKRALSCNMLWSQRPYEVVMSFTRSKPGPRAVRKIGRNLSGTTHPTLPPIGGRPSYSRPKRNCSDLE
ncbi:hypothetical protein L1887_59987 [Cichorium endivia]|nr:hypothetical protein L1887_59987 [Cichorium endivia]